MKKRILSIALAFVMMIAILPTVAFASNWSEEYIQAVKDSARLENASPWAHDAIVNARLEGWLSRAIMLDANYWEYRKDITRAEYAILILQWINSELNLNGKAPITEVDTRDEFMNNQLTMDGGKTSASLGELDLNSMLYMLFEAYAGKTVISEEWNEEGTERVAVERQVPLSTGELREKHLEVYMIFYARAQEFATARRLGIVSPDNINDPITREQAATMIMRAVNVLNLVNDGEIPIYDIGKYSQTTIDAPTADFADIDQVSSWALGGVNFVKANGIMNGTGNGNFTPKANLTVEQAIVLINNIKD